MRIGIDVGGTFTDVVLVDERSGAFHYTKIPTTHYDLAEGVLKGLGEILDIAGVPMDDVNCLIHGTTIGTNAIVEGKGARVGLITTAGFEDVLEIRRVARPKEAAFDFGADNPPPLVPRYLRRGVRERMDSRGRIVLPLDPEDVKAAAGFFRANAVEAVVISFLFSFLNGEHERLAAEVFRSEYPEIPVSLSSEICPEFREYERTCTAVMNGYLGPVIRRYMDNLTSRLSKEYGEVTLHIMQSNGGAMTAELAKSHAAHLINSGPAGGAIATAFVSRLTENPMAVGADMGGTTFDISIVDHNLPKTTTWGGVTNYPIKLPMVDLKTIGAGGGSIAWVDEAGILNVGPESAGSDPGPVCYGWGGTRPTVSDANLVLGRLNPNYFLGGKLPLYPEEAREAIRTQVAEPMGLGVEQAAAGILRIVNANMAKGISGNSVERGYDLREFALVTMGGAAALHAADIAGELKMARVIVPPMSGNFSAVGFVVADIQHDYVRTLAQNQDQLDPAELFREFREMEEEGVRQLREEKVPEETMEITWSADLRYEGQSWELNVAIERRPAGLAREDIEAVARDFHSLHYQVYSYSEPGENVEFVNLRVRVKGRSPRLRFPSVERGPFLLESGWKEKRDVYFAETGWEIVPVYEREELPVGSRILGPALVEETISTALIPPGFQGSIDRFRNIVIDLARGGQARPALGGDP